MTITRPQWLAAAVIGAATLGTGGAALAQTGSTSPASTTPGAPTTTAPGSGRHAHQPHLDGIITATSTDHITIVDHEGFTRTINTLPSTVYRNQGTATTAPALSTGTHIRAEGAVDPDKTSLDATTIETSLAPPPGGKGHKGPGGRSPRGPGGMRHEGPGAKGTEGPGSGPRKGGDRHHGPKDPQRKQSGTPALAPPTAPVNPPTTPTTGS